MIIVYLTLLAAAIFALSSVFYFDVSDGAEFIALVLFAPFCAALVAFGYGVYSWLKHGEWRYMTTLDAAREAGIPIAPLVEPSGWVGIDRASMWVAGLNVGWVCVAIGFIVFFSIVHWSEKGSMARHVERLRREHQQDAET